MQFEIATLLSMGTSRYYNTKEPDPTYLSPILVPLIQPGGSTLVMRYSGSQDGMVEDVSFTENVSAINGHQYIRWQAEMRSNIFTTARPRIENLDIPFTFEFAGG